MTSVSVVAGAGLVSTRQVSLRKYLASGQRQPTDAELQPPRTWNFLLSFFARWGQRQWFGDAMVALISNFGISMGILNFIP
jgi:hypothetical protein